MAIKKQGLVLGATAAMLTAIAVTGAGLHHFSSSEASLRESPKELVDKVWQIINNQYVDESFNELDWEQVRTEYLERSYENQDEAYDAIREMLEQLKDPYTRFMDPEEFQNMQIDTSGELTGVGIQITKNEETDELLVIAPIEETPAFDAGIIAQDVIKKIDGKSTEGLDINDAVQLIRGKPGSKVTLTIERKTGESETDEQQTKLIDFSIVRARIQLHPVKARVETTPLGEVGYIRLTQFSSQAAQEMRQAIRDLEKESVSAYILDLRSNPGGLLYSSIEIARMWLDDGIIVSTVDREGVQERQRASHRALTDKPMAVLIDGGSASASEILSGALQDHKRAVLIGTKTFGKGLVQSVRGLDDGSGLAVTIAKYLTPSGRDINKEGIPPDIELQLTEEQREALQKDRTQIGTIKDPQFAKAIETLQESLAPKAKASQGNQQASN